jgi:Xaa-Pro aminopeptidase
VIFTPGSINYLSGLDDNSLADPTALIVPADRDPILVLFWFEEGRAANSSWLTDVRLYRVRNDPVPGAGFVPAVVDALRSAGLAGSRIALETGPGGISPADHATLIEAFQDATVDDSWPIVEVVRRVKSDAEIAYIRRAAAITDAGVEAGVGALAVGARDTDVGAAILEAMTRLGSEPPCQGPIVAAGFRAGAPHSSIARAEIRTGDTVFLEFTAQWRRYCAPVMRTAILGGLNPEQARAAEAGGDALQAVIETARPGIAASEVARIAGSIMAPAVASGLRFHGNFGYTVGLGYPPTWTERLGFQLRADNDAPLEAGMTFHLPVSLRKYGEWGICQSETLLITQMGAEPLTRSTPRLHVIDAA